MVRTNRRKGIEEVYGTKLEAMQPARLQAIPQPGMTKTAAMRVASSRQVDARTQRSYITANDYYITTNVPVNATNMRTAPSTVLTHPSKTIQMPMQQSQSAATQALGLGSTSNRRIKPNARQPVPNQQTKVHFVPAENKAHCHPHPHAHNHQYAKPMPMQMTQRTIYVPNTEMDPNLIDLTDKDQMHGNARRAHLHSHPNPNQQHPLQNPHPLQHQLHQQQQLNHPSNSNNNMHHHSHQSMKHQHQQLQQQQHQQQQQQQHMRHSHAHQRGGMQQTPATEDEDKDEDPEEFFELIRQTVRKAVGTTIAEVVTRNFRDLAGKMERFSNELKVTNEHLNKLQSEVTNKVTHYGEENTRHFRYLCMKSEYDKMFYQQQTLTAGKQTSPQVAPPAPANPNATPAPNRVAKQAAVFNNMRSRKQLPTTKMDHGNLKKVAIECVKGQNPCACHSTSKSSHQHPTEEHQSSSDQSVNVKSSELGVREVLGQIQRFCTQMQLNDLPEELPKYPSQTGLSKIELCQKASSVSNSNLKAKAVPSPADTLNMELDTPVDSMEETEVDNFQYSSEEIPSDSEEDDGSEATFNGGTTARAPPDSSWHKLQIQHSNKGAGDCQ